MGPHGGGRAKRALIASLAVLLPAGALSIRAWEPGSTAIAAGGGVGIASVGIEGVPDEPVTTTTTILASTTSTPRTEVPTPVRPTTTTTRRPAVTTTRPSEQTSTLPTTTVATTPLPSRWSATNSQMSVSVRMEPAAPVAGEPVTFTLTVAPGVGCCLAALIGFGDEGEAPGSGPGAHAIAVSQACGNQSPGRGARAHTYAQPGAYRAVVRVVGLECLAEPDQNGVPTGRMVSVEIPMCIGVGPGAQARACAP